MSNTKNNVSSQSAESKIIKIVFSIIGGVISGFLAYFLIGTSIIKLIATQPTAFIIAIIIIIAAGSTGLFIWAFIKAPTVKKMWGRICISIGSIILLFPLSIFILMMSASSGNLTEDTELLGISVMSSMFVTICAGAFCIIISTGFIVGAYFLLRDK